MMIVTMMMIWITIIMVVVDDHDGYDNDDGVGIMLTWLEN